MQRHGQLRQSELQSQDRNQDQDEDEDEAPARPETTTRNQPDTTNKDIPPLDPQRRPRLLQPDEEHRLHASAHGPHTAGPARAAVARRLPAHVRLTAPAQGGRERDPHLACLG